MNDLISRQMLLEYIHGEPVGRLLCDKYNLDGLIEQLPPIQPTDNLQKLADEIASFKRCVKSDNSDYLTGYMCALPAVEGMVADMRGEQDDSV